MVKNLLLYLKANYGKPCSFSPLLSSLTAKNMGAESRSCEVTPDLSLCASTCVCVWVCVHVSQPFIQPSHQISSRDTHIHFWTEVKTVPLARTGEKKQNFLSGRSMHWQKNPMCTCSNRFWVILSLPAFGWHKKCIVILHLFYNSVNTKLSLVAMINTHMHT